MSRFLRKVVDAATVILGEYIEEWATKVTREDLLALVDEQQAQISELELELDSLVKANYQLQSELYEAQVRTCEVEQQRGKDPDPYDPYSGGIWPEKTEDVPKTCQGCYRSFVHCICTPL